MKDWREWRFRALLLALTLLYVAHVVPDVGFALAPIGLITIGLGLVAVAGQRAVVWIATALVLPILVRGAIGVTTGSHGADFFAGSSFHVPFFVFAAGFCGNAALRTSPATFDTLAGAVCAWFLAALAFGSGYAFLESSAPGSFAFAHGVPGEGLLSWMLHFSLATLTTLGYGDVTPVSEIARSLVIFESVIGVLYPAIIVARLVAVASSGGGQPFMRDRIGRPTRAGWVALTLTVAIGLLPWMDEVPRIAVLLIVGLGALLLVAITQLSSGRTVPLLAGVLVVAALLARWVPSLNGFESALDFTFLALVAWFVGQHLLRAERVSWEVLLAAPALYLLIGFGGASAFAVLVALEPRALSGPDGFVPESAELIYLSFMTLTTTGFGEITPLAAPARGLAGGLAAIGIFFPAILVARLVSLYEGD